MLEQARELLDSALGDLARATDELRELARGIHPAALTEGGLRPALAALVSRSSVGAQLVAVPDTRLSAAIEATGYFTVAEALTNVARYAAAERTEVELALNDDCLRVEVRDDGCGGADPAAGSGLRALADRIAALDGHFDVISPPGGGTVLRVDIPCGS